MAEEPVIKFPSAVRRIRMAWRDGKWVVVRSVRVESMTLPRSLGDRTGGQGNTGGSFDAVDGKGRILYRSFAPNPEEQIVELFERDGSMQPHLLTGREPTVEVLVPDHRSLKNLIYRPLRKRAGGSKLSKDQVISIDEITSREKK